VPIGDQDQRRVALIVTAILGGGDQLVDLGGRQVFPFSAVQRWAALPELSDFGCLA
jgi:hypothetical protein